MGRRKQSKKQRIEQALREIRESYKNAAFHRSFGTLHTDEFQHFVIPAELQPFIKQEFDGWWAAWIEPQLKKIEILATPMNPQDFRDVMDKAGLLPTRQYD
jgi:hypothetical protein